MQYEVVFEIWIDDSSPSSTQQITFALHCIFFLKKEYSETSFKLVLKKGRVKKNMPESKSQFPIARFFFQRTDYLKQLLFTIATICLLGSLSQTV